MKTAIYIEDGVTQLVLTPETEWERSVIERVEQGTRRLTVSRGQFYNCASGWTRHGGSDDSLILRTEVQLNN